MSSRPLLRAGRVRRYCQPVWIRLHSSAPSPKPASKNAETQVLSRQQSWLTQKVKSSSVLHTIFLGVAHALGYGSPQQLANRRALHLYNYLCATRVDEDAEFWMNGTSVTLYYLSFMCHDQFPSYRMCLPTNIPIMVHHHQLTRLVAYGPPTRTPRSAWDAPYPRFDRPLFPRCRRTSASCPPAWRTSTPLAPPIHTNSPSSRDYTRTKIPP